MNWSFLYLYPCGYCIESIDIILLMLMLLILFDNVSVLIKLKLSNRIEDTISFSQTDSNFTILGFFSVENDDFIKLKHFPRYWLFVRKIHRSPHKAQRWGALMFSLVCPWINGWVNDGEAGDLRCHRAHYDVIVIIPPKYSHIALIRCRESIRLIYLCF